jgi:hypothetical protein
MFKIDNLMESLTGYFEARVELIKMDIKKDIAVGVSNAVYYGILAMVALLALITLNFAIGYLLGAVFNNTWLGFLVLALVYFAIAGVMVAFRENNFISTNVKASMLANEPKGKSDSNRHSVLSDDMSEKDNAKDPDESGFTTAATYHDNDEPASDTYKMETRYNKPKEVNDRERVSNDSKKDPKIKHHNSERN